MQSCPGVSALGLQHMSVRGYITYSAHSCDKIPNRIKSGARISYGSWFQIWTHQGRKGWSNSPCPVVEDVTKAVHTTVDQEPERHEPQPGYLSQVLALVTHSPTRPYLPKFPEPPTIELWAENGESKALTCQETFHIQTLRGRMEITYNRF